MENGKWKMSCYFPALAAGYRAHDQKGFCARGNRVGQRGVRWFMRQVLPAGEEPQERPALPGDMIADRPKQHRITRLECVDDRSLRDLAVNVYLHFVVDPRQCSQMVRERDSDHVST